MKAFIVIIILAITCTCKPNKDVFFDSSIVEKLSDGQDNLPSKYGNILLFVHSGNNNYIITNNNFLRILYFQYYSKKHKTFTLFLNDTLNEKIIIERNKYETLNLPHDSFLLNEKISNLYFQNSFDDFVEIFCTNKKDSYLHLKRDSIDAVELPTVLYYLYRNNYQISFDDIIGSYTIKKW